MRELLIATLLFHFILLLVYVPYKKGVYTVPSNKLWFYMMLMIVYGTYGNHFGDFYRYDQMIEYYGGTPWYDIGIAMEPLYYYLAKIVHGSPILWRLILNSVSFIGLGVFLKKADMNNYPTLFFFVVMSLFWFAGHRASWGVIFYFFGLYLSFYKRNYFYLLFCSAAFFSHSSHIVLIVLLPIAFIKLSKHHAILIPLVLLASLSLLQGYFDNIVATGLEDEYAAEKLDTYSSQTVNRFFGDSIGEILQNVSSKVPIYIFFFYVFRQYFFNIVLRFSVSRAQKALINISFCLFLASIVCSLLNMGAATIASRLFSFLGLPALILAPQMLQNETSKYYGKFINWKWLSIEFTFLFAIYYSYLHPIQ